MRGHGNYETGGCQYRPSSAGQKPSYGAGKVDSWAILLFPGRSNRRLEVCCATFFAGIINFYQTADFAQVRKKILVLPGDGIGPEIMAEAVKVLDRKSVV